MTEMFIGLLGGIGLFILGMTLLTDGLRAFAGDALRRALIRFTDQPVKAFLSGALATAVVQSSSATTVTMIGFVSAGLLTFPQALGVVLGASLGTTSTGWLVAVLGLKVSVGYYALPLIGVGAFLRLLAPARWKSFGMALAGLGLIFVGIGNLQLAMKDVSTFVDFSSLPAIGLGRRLLIVVVGVVLTVMMQSSSAAVATTLAALHSNSISFDQAALVVIGASIGTTVTGLLASIGASIPAKRTALALVLFTLGAGAATYLTLPWFLAVLSWAENTVGLASGAVRLAAFHSAFVALGIAIVLPFTNRFAGYVERLLPGTGPALTANLDNSMLSLPVVALEAVRRVLRESAVEMMGTLMQGFVEAPEEEPIVRVEQALRTTEDYFVRIPAQAGHAEGATMRTSLLHAMDHLVRLEAYLRAPANVRRMLADARLAEPVGIARETIHAAQQGLRGTLPNGWVHKVEGNARRLGEWNREERPRLLEQTATGASPPFETLHALDAIRWLARAIDHVARICHYLGDHEEVESLAEHERRLA